MILWFKTAFGKQLFGHNCTHRYFQICLCRFAAAEQTAGFHPKLTYRPPYDQAILLKLAELHTHTYAHAKRCHSWATWIYPAQRTDTRWWAYKSKAAVEQKGVAQKWLLSAEAGFLAASEKLPSGRDVREKTLCVYAISREKLPLQRCKK